MNKVTTRLKMQDKAVASFSYRLCVHLETASAFISTREQAVHSVMH